MAVLTPKDSYRDDICDDDGLKFMMMTFDNSDDDDFYIHDNDQSVDEDDDVLEVDGNDQSVDVVDDGLKFIMIAFDDNDQSVDVFHISKVISISFKDCCWRSHLTSSINIPSNNEGEKNDVAPFLDKKANKYVGIKGQL